MLFEIEMDRDFTAKARGVAIEVFLPQMPKASLAKIFEYGLQRILNDAAAGAKNDEEAEQLAKKRLDNLYNGIMRASGSREGNPIKAEAAKIALAKVKAAKGFKAWLADNGLKIGDKDAVAKAKSLASELAQRDDILALAKANVEAAKEIEVELDL